MLQSAEVIEVILKDNIQNDDEFKNTIALSLKELNPKNPWIIDSKLNFYDYNTV